MCRLFCLSLVTYSDIQTAATCLPPQTTMTRRNIFRSFIGLALTRFGHAAPGEQASRPTLLIPSTLGKEGRMATGGGSVPHGSEQSASSRLLPNKGQDNRDWASGMSEPTGCQPGAINSVSLPSELEIETHIHALFQQGGDLPRGLLDEQDVRRTHGDGLPLACLPRLPH